MRRSMNGREVLIADRTGSGPFSAASLTTPEKHGRPVRSPRSKPAIRASQMHTGGGSACGPQCSRPPTTRSRNDRHAAIEYGAPGWLGDFGDCTAKGLGMGPDVGISMINLSYRSGALVGALSSPYLCHRRAARQTMRFLRTVPSSKRGGPPPRVRCLCVVNWMTFAMVHQFCRRAPGRVRGR
jgi:hypothetical protein